MGLNLNDVMIISKCYNTVYTGIYPFFFFQTVWERCCMDQVILKILVQSHVLDGNKLMQGPKDGIVYPIQVVYCGNCTMPIEYCEYYPEYEKCKQWLERNLPSEFEKVKIGDDNPVEEEKKRQKRGGKGMIKTKKKEDGPKQVCVSRAPRGKKKSVTVVTGLSSFDIDLKVAAKFFGTKFACGSSVTGDDEIVIQGDVKDDLFDIIPEKWPEIDEDLIEDLGDQKR